MLPVDILLISRVLSAIALTVGLIFGILQLRQYQARRRWETALTLVHSFQTPAFATALDLLFRMPDGLSRTEVEAWMGQDRTSVMLLISTWESLGILVQRGELNLDLVDDFFSGPIAVTWRKLRRYVEEVRQDEKRETFAEWAQWLAERMHAAETAGPPVPAHIAHRDWRPR